MKKLLLFGLCMLLLLPVVAAQIDEVHQEHVQTLAYRILSIANDDEITDLRKLTARDTLYEEIRETLEEDNVHFDRFTITSTAAMGVNAITVMGNYEAHGDKWHSQGMFMYFTFENKEGKWLLTDTNFYKIVYPSYILKIFGKILLFIFPVFLILFLFWLVMLIHCLTKKDFETRSDRLVWAIALFFMGFTGAVIYYFIIHRKKK